MNDIEKIKEGLEDAVNFGHITHSFSNLIIQTITKLHEEKEELRIEVCRLYDKYCQPK